MISLLFVVLFMCSAQQTESLVTWKTVLWDVSQLCDAPREVFQQSLLGPNSRGSGYAPKMSKDLSSDTSNISVSNTQSA